MKRALRRMKNEAGLRPVKRAFGTRKTLCALRFTATKLPLHTSRKACASYRRRRCFIVIRGQIRTATHLPKPFKNPSHSKNIYKAIDATAFWTDSNQRKPSSGRKGDHEVVEGACATLKFDETLPQRALPQSPAAPAFGPGRKHGLLPALAKNMPPAYFLNASRPPGGSL